MLNLKNNSVISELDQLRSEHVKHFVHRDHTGTAVQYFKPVHFMKEGSSSWSEIDNTLVEKEAEIGGKVRKCFAPADSPIGIRFSADPADPCASITSGKHTVSWRYSFSEPGKAELSLPSPEKLPAGEEDPFLIPQKISGRLLYGEADRDTDLLYILDSKTVKELLILKSAEAPSALEAFFSFEGLRVKEVSEHTLQLIAPDGEPVLTLSAPQMTDAAMAASDRVSLKVLEADERGMRIRLTADPSWLRDPARKFPVSIDPFIWQEVTSFDYDGTHTALNATHPYGSLMVGTDMGYNYGKCMSFVKFPLPALSSGDMVTGGTLSLYQYSGYHGYNAAGTPNLLISAHMVDEAWTQDSLLHTSSSYHLPATEDTILDFKTISSDTCGHATFFDVTEAVKKWYDGTALNYGICIKAVDETAWALAAFIAANNTYYNDYIPYLAVFCKPRLQKVAKRFCRLLHLHFVGDCRGLCRPVLTDRTPLQTLLTVTT